MGFTEREPIQVPEVINGTISRLQRINTDEVDTLVTLFQSREVYRNARFEKAPNREKLRGHLENFRLLVWKLLPTDGDSVTGAEVAFIGWGAYAPPYFFFVIPTTEIPNLEVLRDGVEHFAKTSFECCRQRELYFYHAVPVPEEIHTFLVEGGFDLLEEVSGIDPEKEATYVLERQTYKAYYVEDYGVDGEH